MSGPESLPVGSVRVDAADPTFAVRGPFWRPGHSVAVEPWTVLVEDSTGARQIPCGRDDRRAGELAGQLAAATTGRFPSGVLGVVVIAPDGTPSHGWAADGGPPPVPGAPRWSRLRRVVEPEPCPRCGAARWVGCWVGEAGCGICHDDGRPAWPVDPPEPPAAVVKAKTKRTRS